MLAQKPLVELPSACPGKGEYVALVHYATPNGELFSKTLKYSYKDPRTKDRTQVLQDIARMVGARERRHIVSISVVKRCLHPKGAAVPKVSRRPHFERLFAVVIQHAQSDFIPSFAIDNAALHHLVPCTPEELQWLPLTDVITTRFRLAGQPVIVGLRGIEEIATVDEALGFSPQLSLAP